MPAKQVPRPTAAETILGKAVPTGQQFKIVAGDDQVQITAFNTDRAVAIVDHRRFRQNRPKTNSATVAPA